jgi:hypothetical protein
MRTWFWCRCYKPQSPEGIAVAYRLSIKGIANLLMNMTPDNTGRIPQDQVETFRKVAELIREKPC